MAVSVIRTAVLYVVLMAAMRLMGKRQLGDMQPVELAVTLLIADMAAVAVSDTDTPLLAGLLPMGTLVALELLLSGLLLKWPSGGRLVGGRPVVLIRQGHLDETALRRLRMTLEDVLSALRQQGVFDVESVAWAVAETGGKISVALKPDYQPLTARPPDRDIPFVLIGDGRVSNWGLQMSGLGEGWLDRWLAARHTQASAVFLLTADCDGHTYCIMKGESG